MFSVYLYFLSSCDYALLVIETLNQMSYSVKREDERKGGWYPEERLRGKLLGGRDLASLQILRQRPDQLRSSPAAKLRCNSCVATAAAFQRVRLEPRAAYKLPMEQSSAAHLLCLVNSWPVEGAKASGASYWVDNFQSFHLRPVLAKLFIFPGPRT